MAPIECCPSQQSCVPGGISTALLLDVQLSLELELGWIFHMAEVPSQSTHFLLCQWGQEGQGPHLWVQVTQFQQEVCVSSVSMWRYRGS